MEHSLNTVTPLENLGVEVLKSAFELSRSPLIITDCARSDNPIIYSNQAFLDLCGYDMDEIIGANCRFLQGADTDPAAVAKLRSGVKKGESVRVTIKNYRKDGEAFWNDLIISPIVNDEGTMTHFVGMQLDITERIEAERQRQTLELQQTKDEFVSIASHQLRTPATAVKQYVGMIVEGLAGDVNEQQRALLNRAYESNERQLSVINELLKTAQLDNSNKKLKAKTIDINGFVSSVISEILPSTDMRSQTVVADLEPGLEVRADSNDLRLALTNILENASKYTPEGKRITVATNHDDRYVYIVVSDEGVGIAKKDQARIFEKFSRVDNELSDTVQGSGLGLYWVKRIVALHDGTISVNSAKGQGTTFTIGLPK